MKHIARKIRKGHYEYRGYEIHCIGYYEPEHKVCWEANLIGEYGADFHGYSLREIKYRIDEDLDKEEQK